MKPPQRVNVDDDLTLPGPFDSGEEAEELWFLPPDEEEGGAQGMLSPLPRAGRMSLVDAAAWRAAEAALSADLAELTFDLGRLAERMELAGQGAVQRLALWLSYRIGAAEEGGEGLIRTAWAARRLGRRKWAGVRG